MWPVTCCLRWWWRAPSPLSCPRRPAGGFAFRRHQPGPFWRKRKRLPPRGVTRRRRAFGLCLMTDTLALAGSVGLVFAFTASTICPVLLLGIWWRGLTDAGAIAGGMLIGALLCGGAMVAGTLMGPGNAPAWLAQPAAWSVPAAFAVTVTVSIMTKHRVPASVNRVMSRLHVPERPVVTER